MKAQDLKNSVLQLAVQGKLVEQNPDDEPAAVLLEKIKAEKARLVKEKKIKADKFLPEITEDEIPFEIPESWAWCRLAQISSNIPSKLYQILKTEIKADGKFPVVSQSAVRIIDGYNDNKSKLLKVVTPIIIFGDHTKAIKYIDFDFIVGADGTKILLPILIEPLYLFYLLEFASINMRDRGYSRHFQFINDLFLPLPPRSDQKRIIEMINELQPMIDAYDKAERELTNLNNRFPDDLKKSVLQYAVQGKLVEQNPEDEPAAVLLKKIKAEKARLVKEKKIKADKVSSSIYKGEDGSYYENVGGEIKCIDEEIPFEIPESWVWCRLIDCCNDIADIDHKMPLVEENGYPYISPTNFTNDNGIDYINAKRISKNDFLNLSKKVKPERDDIIFPRYGTIGIIRLIDTDIDFLVSYSCATIKTSKLNSLPKYLYYALQSQVTKNEIAKYINKTTQPNVGLQSIKQFLFPFPPIAEQKRIVEKAEELLQICDRLN